MTNVAETADLDFSQDSLHGKKPPVSVVIVNHNAGAVLRECVLSIASQAREVLLVENGSDPGSAERILGDLVSGGTVKLLILPANLGFSAACNHGIHTASQETILLLNPDAIAAPGLVRRLLETFARDSKIGMVGGFLQNPDRTEQRGGRRLIPTPARSLARGLGLAFLGRLWPSLGCDFNLNNAPLPDDALEVEAVSGACMLLRRAALEEIGMMDEDFFLHCEDLDLCFRFRERGWKIFFDPQAHVVHLKGVCGRRKPVFVEWNKHRGMIRFYRKHFRYRYPSILFGVVICVVWMRFIAVGALSLVRSRHQSVIPQKAPVYSELPKNAPTVGVLGATSFVGQTLLPLLLGEQNRVIAYSRGKGRSEHPRLVWQKLGPSATDAASEISNWISLCPLPVLASLLPKLAGHAARRLVAVSSTSRFTKMASRDANERCLAESLAAAEEAVLKWGRETSVEIVILRPTMVYDGASDRNIAAVASFVRRYGWFPVLAPATGLRQPLHVSDLAEACSAALSPSAPPGVYDLSGGETLPYREMIARIFAWEGVPLKLVEVPRICLRILGFLPRACGLSAETFERMNEHLTFDHSLATECLGFHPRNFVPPC